MEWVNVQDEDCHWYYMPSGRVSEFKKLLYDEDDSGLQCWERSEWQEFEDYRTGGDRIEGS